VIIGKNPYGEWPDADNCGAHLFAKSAPVSRRQLAFRAVQPFQQFGLKLFFGFAFLVGADLSLWRPPVVSDLPTRVAKTTRVKPY
jgi:hypothetical protein